MALNLDKSAKEKQFFYEKNGNTFGPFNLSVLLSKIEADTLVLKEGGNWANAKEIPELKNHFKAEDLISKKKEQTQPSSNKPIVEQKKSNSGLLWVLIIIIGAGIGYFIYNKKNSDSDKNVVPIDSTSLVGIDLTDLEIFDIESVSNFVPTEEQKTTSSSLLEKAKAELANKNITDAIINLKESLKNSPQANTYFQLSDAYLKTNDFERSELCLQLANGMDFQPKSDLNNKLIAIHVIQGKYDIATTEINSQIALNKNYLTSIEKDPIFYSYKQSPDYLSLIEKNSIMDSTSDYFLVINSFFESFNNNEMNASYYFSEQVTQYINIQNVTPDEINELNSSNTEFINGQQKIIGNKIIVSGYNSREVWIIFKCFRNSKKKYQECRVKIEFIFDDQNKITSYKELSIMDLKLSK